MGITRVVAATDFSPEADLALTHGVAIARRHGAALTIVYADADRVGVDAAHGKRGGVLDSIDDELVELAAAEEAEARAELEARVAAASGAGIDTDGVLRVGAPDEVIAAVAADLAAELTVIGTHGRTGVKRFFLGSERLVKRTPDAALVVRGEAPPHGYRRVLIATDFSDAATAALDAALALAAPDAQVDVLHAWQYPVGTWGRLAARSSAFQTLRDAIVAEADAHAAEVVAHAAARGRTVHVDLRQGAPAATIADAADHGHHDLIAVGTHGHRGVRRFLLGSVAEAVVRHAHCSVLVVHAQPGPQMPRPRVDP